MISATGQKKKSRGFTLIEIMISIAILSLGLIFVLQGLTHCLSILRISQNNLEASLLAEDKMAELEIAIKQEPDKLSKDTSGESRSGNIEFKWEIRLSPDQEYEELNEVKAAVYWREGRRTGSSVFNTYLMVPNGK
ncbi:MAG: prepilin-type N-terminal cleavage/methylation domain-containing protein [Candidatus Omnitrophica bacterium]|nr:prepilin-type N-terminal cleavage/methylation domain-containing protein [Candidatus Omnitrophota bacterium]